MMSSSVTQMHRFRTGSPSPLLAPLLAPLAAALLGVAPGCFGGYDGAFIEAQDVVLDVPGQVSMRSAASDEGTAQGEPGDVYLLVRDTATGVNGWVGETVDGIATVVGFLNGHRETSREGTWRIYGPFNDDEGRDASWMVKIEGDDAATAFEVHVGDYGSSAGDMDLLMEGNVAIDGEQRSGGFTLHFDAVEAHPELKSLPDAGKIFSGAIAVTFDRNVATEQKTVEIEFQDFREETFSGDEAWWSDERYVYRREDDGGGAFHLAVYGQFDDNAWGGYRTNKMEIDGRWDATESGRARGRILEVDNADSGLPDGDLVIQECFARGGELTWRRINEPYASQTPSYNLGEETTCVFSESDMG